MSQKLKHIIVFILMVCYSTFFSACYTPAGRSPGDVVDDATITTQIKTSLLAEKVLSGIAISVTTFEGEVILTGAVNNYKQKTRASDIANSIRGVKKVENLLKIK
ncbi:MAG: BON domain-containing protein [Proteobacteria bacterium]|nr:BON domain-containing protein [Pseudomonadota bacterium]MBU1649269.1 BON domain-containing protein [Pseudomonadota bacterium]